MLVALAGTLLLAQGCTWRVREVRASEYEFLPDALPSEPEGARSGSGGSESDARPGLCIDLGFIAAVEGEARTSGYVPTSSRTGRVLGRSGVTIGTGFDLGQHDAADLRRMGLPPELVHRLAPYLGTRGRNAKKLLERRPLRLPAEDVARLDRAKLEDTAAKIERAFDRARAEGVPSFAELDPGRQTAIVSLAMQYGTRLDRAAPAFWEHVVHGRFEAAREELTSFGDRYATRRNREAKLLVRGEHLEEPAPAAEGPFLVRR